MREHATSSSIETKHDPGSRASTDVSAQIVDLARSSVSQSAFFTQTLRCVARFFTSPYAAVHVRFASEVVQDDWHLGATDPQFWKPGLQRFLTDVLAEPRAHAQLLHSKSKKVKVAFLASPICDTTGRPIGCLALVVEPIEDGDIENRLQTLEAIVRLASYSAAFVGSDPQPSVVDTSNDRKSGTAGRALARAARCSSLEELAFALTNDLCNKLDCQQVILGMVSGSSVELVSISGMDTIQRKSPGVVRLRAAMEECLDAKRPLVCQSGKGWSDEEFGHGYRLHKQWRGAAQGDAVASLPLHVDDRCIAVLSMRRRAEDPFNPELLAKVTAMVEPFAPALLLTLRAHRSLWRHAKDSIRGAVEVAIRPGHVGTKVLAALGLVFALWFVFGSLDYSLTVPCKVRPGMIRHVSAPFEGMLTSATVVEGDRVRKGDVLCELDHRELDQQRTELSAELAVLERTKDRARADNLPVEVQLALANQQLVQARLDLVDLRIERATLLAPFDGVIVSGDLRKSIGGIMARGESLFEIAPFSDWTLELFVPDSASGDLDTDLSGFFASYARPEESRPFRIERIIPKAQVENGRNVFVAEARIGGRADWIRPGLEGVAKIQVGRRGVWWITLHRAIDYLRMNFLL